MTTYKFRSADQLPYALDIIFNQRLYCASKAQLNDPQEGWFDYMPWESREREQHGVQSVVSEQSKLRICSLTATCKYIPLWAYYASGFSGLALELDIPEEAPEMSAMRYTNDRSIGLLHIDDPRRAARESLCMKRAEWSHEEELRIIVEGRDDQAGAYFQLANPVRQVIVGCRIQPAVVQTLLSISKERGFKLCGAFLKRDGISLDPYPPANG